MALPVKPEFLPSDECAAFASWLNVLLVASLAPEKPATFELAAKNIARVLRRHPRGVGLLLLILHHEKPPPEFTERALGLMQTFRPQMLGIATVLEAQGFAGAAHRAFGQGIIALSRMQGVLTLHGTVAEAVSALSPRVLSPAEQAPGAVALRAACGDFQSRVHHNLARAL